MSLSLSPSSAIVRLQRIFAGRDSRYIEMQMRAVNLGNKYARLRNPLFSRSNSRAAQ